MGADVRPRDLHGVAALMAAERTSMCKVKGEKDTEFVKRIVCAYLNAEREIDETVSLARITEVYK